MSEDSRITGAITIEPPITWAETKGLPVGWMNVDRSQRDALLRVVRDDTHTDTGITTVMTCDAIIPERQDQNGRRLVEDVQEIVDRFGAGRTFTGHLEVMWRGDGSVSRIVVRDGCAVEIQPIVTWPAD